MAGDEDARYHLGQKEVESGNMERAVKHFMIGASAGCHNSMHRLIACFGHGLVSRESINSTLISHKNSCACQVCACLHQSSVFSLVLALRGIPRSGSTLNRWRQSVGFELFKLFRFAGLASCWKRLLSIPKFVSVSIANRVYIREDSEATSCRKFLNLNLKLLKDY
jgi:hypothetical protein